MNKTETVISFILAVSALIIVFLSAFEMVAFDDMDYYGYEFEKNRTAETTGFGGKTLEAETMVLINYMISESKWADEKFENSSFFNLKEKLHMSDVKNIVQKAVYIRRISIVLFFVSVLAAAVFNVKKEKITFAFTAVFGLFLILLSFTAVFTALDFNTAFVAFHKVFFNNDLWLFDPSKSVLINMVPEEFFIDTVFRICVVLFAVCGTVFVYSFFAHKNYKMFGRR